MVPSPERLVVSADTPVFQAGDPATAAYFILSGTVELIDHDGSTARVIGTRGKNELFGKRALLGDAPRAMTARTVGECELLVITPELLSDRIAGVDPMLRLCISALFSEFGEPVEGVPPPEGGVPKARPAWRRHFADARDILAFEHELRRGIERDELDVHFQPIVRLIDRKLAGFEALVRWRHPQRGMLQPNDFIPLAEASGVISDITFFCLRKVGGYFPALKAAGLRRPDDLVPLFLSVNVSGVDLMQPAFAAKAVSALCDDEGVEPEDIRLEVTESILMTDADRCTRTLENCRAQGFKIAIDDFGTGYSSLNYLNTLPVSVLKMDRSFTLSLLDQPVGRKIIGAILQLGGELGLSVIAEGVESELQAAMLQAMGCEFGQGYLFGRAAAQADTLALIEGWQARPPAPEADAPGRRWA